MLSSCYTIQEIHNTIKFQKPNDGYFLKNKRQMRRKTMQELYMSV